MRSWVLSLLILSASLFSSSGLAQISSYGFPDLSSDLATVCSLGIHVPESESENLSVRVLKPTSEFRYKKLKLRFYPAKNDAKGKHHDELVVILSGLGGETNSVFSRFYAQRAQDAGFNVLVFPNTITPSFVLSSSTHGVVGETERDAADLYRAIEASLGALEEQKGIKTDSIKLLGFSHGALMATAVDALNAQKRNLPIHSVMMVNPPVNLLYGLRNLDSRVKAGKKIAVPRLIKLALRFQKLLKTQTAEPTTLDTFRKFSTDLRLKPEEQYALIGIAMKGAFSSTILASQEVDDLGVLPEVSPEGSTLRRSDLHARSMAASGFSFEGYMTTFFGAQAKRDGRVLDFEDLGKRSSLIAYENHLRRAYHITMVHNLDDILLNKGDAEWLKSVMQERARFYPRGGHLGNVWFNDNLRTYQEWLLK